MSNYPFQDPVSHITGEDLEELLRNFEDAWAKDAGRERITSAQFYDGYRSGELDSIFGMAWAAYYESWRALNRRQADTVVTHLPGALLAH
jgi:hypothetical protein